MWVTLIMTFDLYSDLILVSSGNVADYAQVGSLVFYPYTFDLQSPISVGLKAVSLKISLSVFGPMLDNKQKTMRVYTPTQELLSVLTLYIEVS